MGWLDRLRGKKSEAEGEQGEQMLVPSSGGYDAVVLKYRAQPSSTDGGMFYSGDIYMGPDHLPLRRERVEGVPLSDRQCHELIRSLRDERQAVADKGFKRVDKRWEFTVTVAPTPWESQRVTLIIDPGRRVAFTREVPQD
jgi:hypothetical protein